MPKAKRKRAKCKCHDMRSCEAYVKKAVRAKHRFAKGKAHKAWADQYYKDVY